MDRFARRFDRHFNGHIRELFHMNPNAQAAG